MAFLSARIQVFLHRATKGSIKTPTIKAMMESSEPISEAFLDSVAAKMERSINFAASQ
jgi:hypothetical protein